MCRLMVPNLLANQILCERGLFIFGVRIMAIFFLLLCVFPYKMKKSKSIQKKYLPSQIIFPVVGEK